MINHRTNSREINVVDNQDTAFIQEPSGIEGINDRVIKCVPAINKDQIVFCCVAGVKFWQGMLTSFFNELPIMKTSLCKVACSNSAPLRVLKWINYRMDGSLSAINCMADVESGQSIGTAYFKCSFDVRVFMYNFKEEFPFAGIDAVSEINI